MEKTFWLFGVIILIFISCISTFLNVFAFTPLNLTDPSLKATPVIEDLPFFPSNMAFLEDDDLLVLDKNNGTVHRITNGVLNEEPLLKVNVSNVSERGMLGIAIDAAISPPNVYLYFTEVSIDSISQNASTESIKNRLYKYDLVENSLINPRVLLNLPALPGPAHNGGSLIIGPDHNLYLSVGDVYHRSLAQNVKNDQNLDGTGGILRVTKFGNPVENDRSLGIGNFSLYFAYGIRNSFGIDFDPVTGRLWDSENGPDYGDEINLVDQNFNSGWNVTQGLWTPAWSNIQGYGAFMGERFQEPQKLVNFNGRGKYSAPELTTANFTIAPTALKFLSSDKLGEQYKNDLFIADFLNGSIYRLELDRNRSNLDLTGPLSDKVADSPQELKAITFGVGFGSISDLEQGPDGNLYVLSAGKGAIFKIEKE